MNKNQAVKIIVTLALCLLILGCGVGSAAIPTLTSIPTPTQTQAPAGVITGHIWLLDRNEAVQTTVFLFQGTGEDYEEVDRTETDTNGNFSFRAMEPGSYSLGVSINQLLEVCPDLSVADTEANANYWTYIIHDYDEGFLSDVFIKSIDIAIEVPGEITVNCELNCN